MEVSLKQMKQKNQIIVEKRHVCYKCIFTKSEGFIPNLL